ncbi:MAG: imidazoleglycerol-phosphate dehydratase HisB [Oscillospiraceae bacterium]|jgi:imidazoleglycerol-phosphate dehydratase|nr:imidazoleglycerol-phosphate dehydratase HisB [Oscillospiraceae bacterium]
MTRVTKETSVRVELNPAGGEISISTGIGFFDHMLTALAFHAGFGLRVKAEGDLIVDGHHTVEDVGIVLGQAFREVTGAGIERFGSAHIPMDESLGFCAVDVGGRAFLRFDGAIPDGLIGTYDASLSKEFFRAFSANALISLHLSVTGENAHHMTEALYKACGVALRHACAPRKGGGVPSTKGAL